MQTFSWLIAGAILSGIASLLHVAIIFGGPQWYRFFGAGEGMAKLAESGSISATLITLGIAGVLAIFSMYALSGAGLITRLPFLKFGLLVISSVYFVRGIAGLVLAILNQMEQYANHAIVAQNSATFWCVSSLICLLFAMCYMLGTWRAWENL